MKRLLLIGALILFESLVCSAQGPVVDLGPNQTLHFFGAPSGSCRSNQYAENNVNGDFYNCLNNAWNKVSGAGGGGTVTGVLGTANQIVSDGSSTTPTMSLSSTLIFPGTATLASATTAVANSPLFTISGSYQNSATPTFLADNWTIQNVIAAGTNGQAKLTFLHSGSTSTIDELNLFSDGVRLRNGIILLSASGTVQFTGRGTIASPVDGVHTLLNAAQTGYTRLNFGGTTSSFPALGVSGTSVTLQLADGTAGGTFAASSQQETGLFGATQTNTFAACETAGAPTTLSTGATTTNTGLNCLPANSIIDFVVYRITTTITTAANFTIGDGSTAGRFCGTQSTLTAGTTGTCMVQWTSATAGTMGQVSAAAVRVTTNANPGAGAIRLIVFYHTAIPPTS